MSGWVTANKRLPRAYNIQPNKYTVHFFFKYLFVCVDALCPSQQFFSIGKTFFFKFIAFFQNSADPDQLASNAQDPQFYVHYVYMSKVKLDHWLDWQ